MHGPVPVFIPLRERVERKRSFSPSSVQYRTSASIQDNARESWWPRRVSVIASEQGRWEPIRADGGRVRPNTPESLHTRIIVTATSYQPIDNRFTLHLRLFCWCSSPYHTENKPISRGREVRIHIWLPTKFQWIAVLGIKEKVSSIRTPMLIQGRFERTETNLMPFNPLHPKVFGVKFSLGEIRRIFFTKIRNFKPFKMPEL